MNVLVLTATLPPVPDIDVGGVYKRLSLFMTALGEIGASIHIAHIVAARTIEKYPDRGLLARQQSMYWSHAVSVSLIPRQGRRETAYNHYVAGTFCATDQPAMYPFAGSELTAAVSDLLGGRPDLIFVHRLAAMVPMLALPPLPCPLLFDLDDVEHRALARASLSRPIWPGKVAYLAHVPALLALERRAAARAALTFVCSEIDRGHLARWRIAGNAAVIPNAVKLPHAPPPVPSAPNIMFIGNYEYGPNADAAERLIRRILPMIRVNVPSAHLLIAGKGSDRLPSFCDAPDGVAYLGFVDDIDALYAQTRLVCCPITSGAGTRLKLIEAAGYARPMVATRIGAEGLAFRDGQEILLRDSDRDITDACVRLLHDQELCRRLGDAARLRMRQVYDADAIRSQIVAIIRKQLAL